MYQYTRLQKNILNDLLIEKIDIRDYIRVRRDMSFDIELIERFGVCFIPIKEYKYDDEIIKVSEKDQFELIKVRDLLKEISQVLSLE